MGEIINIFCDTCNDFYDIDRGVVNLYCPHGHYVVLELYCAECGQLAGYVREGDPYEFPEKFVCVRCVKILHERKPIGDMG